MRPFSKISVHIICSLTLVSEIQIESTAPYNNAKKTTIVDEQGLDQIIASVKEESSKCFDEENSKTVSDTQIESSEPYINNKKTTIA